MDVSTSTKQDPSGSTVPVTFTQHHGYSSTMPPGLDLLGTPDQHGYGFQFVRSEPFSSSIGVLPPFSTVTITDMRDSQDAHLPMFPSTPSPNGGAHSDDFQLTMTTPHDHDTPATSPATPVRLADPMTTRSGRVIKATANPLKSLAGATDRVGKSAPRKRKERTKANRKSDFKMVMPLSEIAEKEAIPIIDIGAYVQRSADVRQRELVTGKNPGKVKRPMNAFMLYRKAYQNVAKQWCTHNNHQVVSQVCGDSWPLEPPHIKDQFSEWARMERDNHQLAHPNYKFTPAKPRQAKKDLEESDESELDDLDWAGGHGRGSGASRRNGRPGTASSDEDYRPSRNVHRQAMSNHHHHQRRQLSSQQALAGTTGMPPSSYSPLMQSGMPFAPSPYWMQAQQNMGMSHHPGYGPAGSYGYGALQFGDVGGFAQFSPHPSHHMHHPHNLHQQCNGNSMGADAYPDPAYLHGDAIDPHLQMSDGQFLGGGNGGGGPDGNYSLLADPHAPFLAGGWQVEFPGQLDPAAQLDPAWLDQETMPTSGR